MSLSQNNSATHSLNLGLCVRTATSASKDRSDTAHQVYYSKVVKDYKDASEVVKDDMDADRFQKMADRKRESEMTSEMFKFLYLGQETAANWKGVAFGKSAYCVATYTQLIQELQPKTIIDIGSWCGGSALWFADMTEILVGKDFCKVVSTDICGDNFHEKAKAHPKIEFHEIDSNRIDELFTEEFCKTLPHPWFACEDGHFGFQKIMETFHKRMLPGDYLMVEDTAPVFDQFYRARIDSKLQGKIFTEEEAAAAHEEQDVTMEKGVITQKYGLDYPDKYRVDSKYQDMFGYNAGKSMNAMLKVIA